MSIRVNIGCGQTPISGWRNYDNSWGIILAKLPIAVTMLSAMGLLNHSNRDYINFIKKNKIIFADAAKHIPEKNDSIEVLYSSHMFEHLDIKAANFFLKESHRVLKSGGILRLIVPDLRLLAAEYMRCGDGDIFIENTLLTRPRPKTILQKMKYLLVGDRNHQWMYDGISLCKMVSSAGFLKPRIMEPGQTIISDSGPLDLFEGALSSVVVEAIKS